MSRFLNLSILIAVLLLYSVSPSAAVVDVGLLGQNPLTIEDVYQREGTAFVAIDDVLKALGLEGQWDSVEHLYRIHTPRGWAVISPGSQFLRLGDNFVPIAHRPRFIDGKLRVSEVFLLQQLSPLLTEPIYYRNHNPSVSEPGADPLERLFAFLLRKKESVGDHGQRVVAIDPGHGGSDPGAIGLNGSKEKNLTLAVAQRLEKLLKMHQAAPVVMTRNDDYAVDLDQRLAIIGDAGADVMLSLHAQAFSAAAARGTMLYVQPQSTWEPTASILSNDASILLAESLRGRLVAAGFPVHAIQELPILPLGRGDLPRVLVELGSLTNAEDLAAIQDATRQQDLARALFDGLQRYFTAHQETVHEYPPQEPERRPEN